MPPALTNPSRRLGHARIVALLGLCLNACAPQMAMTPRQRGDSLLSHGHYDSAAYYYGRAIKRNPDDPSAYSGRARAYSRDIDLDEWADDKPGADLPAALADADKAVALNPDDPQLYLNRGVIRAVASKHDDALADVEHALRLRPDDGLSHGYRGLILLRMFRDAEAQTEFDRCLKLQPGSRRELDRYISRIKAKRRPTHAAAIPSKTGLGGLAQVTLPPMKAAEVLTQLEKLADPQTKKTWARHGCPEPLFGVKIADMKSLIKKLKISGDTQLAKDLYKTKNGDAMYLAGLIARGSDMTRAELNDWANRARWHMISEYTIPGVATEHPEAWELGLEWIESPKEKVAAAGWMTLAGVTSIRPDEQLDLKAVEKLLDRCAKTIHKADNTVRYAMNCFVISVGCYVKPLTARAKAAAAKMGEVKVDMGDTACKVPRAADYIEKVAARGRIGVKRKSMKC